MVACATPSWAAHAIHPAKLSGSASRCPCWEKSVSYTHLDVYKRQVVDSVFVSWVSEEALTAVSLAFSLQTMMIAVGVGTGVGAVSYTHLDVYKRQL